MLSPDCYYNQYIKDKSPEEIKKRIKGLIKQISYLNNSIEVGKDLDMCPSYSTQSDMNRLYLEIARTEYAKYSNESTLTRKEKRGIDFNNKLYLLYKIEFQIGGYPSPWNTYILEITDFEIITKDQYDFEIPTLLTKEYLLESLKSLYIGEWNKSYTPDKYGIQVLDGTGWDLKFYFKDGIKKEYSGYNHCPYNFNQLLEILDIDLDYEVSAVVEYEKRK
jgi:hypothetical protein